jgi:two-component system, NtrC family, response regulator GlrR
LHAELELREDGLWVRDVGSRNGTFVDEIRVIEARLDAGRRLRLGSIEIQIAYDGGPVPVELWPDDHFGPLVGRSVAMRELFARLARIARTDSTVLIDGETGTGKEVVARAIHERSARREGPFVIVDCGSIPETLLESELFGHNKGAFTGASTARAGALRDADGGTVLLDEIGELPLSLQPKLLRFLESKTVRRLGETHGTPADVRVIAVTHRDLSSMVNAGAFREDLYFRLAVLKVHVPPLRERHGDVPLLVERFRSADREIDPAWLAEIAGRAWVGNVRELRNVVEQVEAFGVETALSERAGHERFPEVSIHETLREIRDRWIAHAEREYLAKALAAHGGNVSAVARAAGLDRSHVYRLMLKHGL